MRWELPGWNACSQLIQDQHMEKISIIYPIDLLQSLQVLL